MNKISACALIVFYAVFLAPVLSAAEDPEETEYAYGTVIAIDLSANTIVIREQDYDKDAESDVTYYFSPDTAFENINSLKEISAGNDVDISYLTKNAGQRSVKFISVYKPELEDEEE